MKRLIFPLLLVFFSIAHAEDKAQKKEPLPQQISSHVDSLNKKVEAWQSKSEDAGRQSRETVDRRLSQWKSQWRDLQSQGEAIYHRLRHGYYAGRRSLSNAIDEVQSVRHQFESFLHSK